MTALGIEKDTKGLGYSVTNVKGEEFTKAREISVANTLVGKIAGLNSSAPSTGPGGSSRVTIRGNSSLSYDNQPLYVVNGIQLNNENLGNAGKWDGADYGDGISSINPDDIQDITVLKGGSAAALYGQRGRNGVILITTKSSKIGKGLGVEFNSNSSFDRINDFTDFQQVYGQGTLGTKPANAVAAMNTGLSSWGAPLDGSSVVLFDGKEHPYSAVSKDNMKDFYQTGSTFTNTLAISGGSEAGSFRMSLGDLRNTSVYPNSDFKRNNFNLDVNYKLSKKFTGHANLNYTKESGNRSKVNDAPGNGNYAIMFLPPNVKGSYLAPGYDAAGDEILYNSDRYTTNPYFAANRFKTETSKDRILSVASIRYTPVEWLYVQGRVANDFYLFDINQITPTGTAYYEAGKLDVQKTVNYNETNADVLVGFNKELTPEFSLGITAGANLLKMKSKTVEVSASGLAYPFLYNPATASSRSATVSEPEKEVHSVYASAELSYKNALFLTLTDRNDWSSTLPAGNNSYNYPSASASYVFTESFNVPVIDFGKVRVGFSKVGGDAPVFATGLYYSTLGAVNGQAIGDLTNEIPNGALEPLQVKEVEIGTELKFLNERLFVDLAWYKKQTLNDIVSGTVSRGSGFQTALVNVGKIQNSGVELLIGGAPIVNESFKWTTSFNFTNNKNKVISLAEGQTDMQMGESRTERAYIKHMVGQPFSQVMAYDFKRDESGKLILGPTGLPQASDLLTAMGTGVHPITGGWSNDISYKNFTLSFLIDYKFGGVIYSGTNARAYSYGLHKETLEGREGGVEVSGVNDDGDAISSTVSAQNYYSELFKVSALHVYDADFIKFRSLSLTYNFPASVLKNKVQGLSISLVGRNLFYIMKKTDNIDPESNYNNSNAQGLEYASLPTVKTYGVNINVKF